MRNTDPRIDIDIDIDIADFVQTIRPDVRCVRGHVRAADVRSSGQVEGAIRGRFQWRRAWIQLLPDRSTGSVQHRKRHETVDWHRVETHAGQPKRQCDNYNLK